jgi:DNA-directed RNA polymerase specialized sigma24 family protein
LRKDAFAKADQSKGRFRSFLLGSLEYFLKDEWKRASAQKRGGGQVTTSLDTMSAEDRYKCEPSGNVDPAKSYERDCTMAVLSSVLKRLKASFEAEGKPERFEQLKPFLLDQDGDYTEAAGKLGVSVGAVRTAVHRLHKQFRETLKEEIANTVATPEEVDEEISYMLALLGE